MGRYTEIPQDTFESLQVDAGVLLKNFNLEAAASDPTSPGFTNEDIICATTGGLNPSCVPSFSDMGEDVDNCPVNMKELKKLESWETKISTTSLGTSARLIKLSLGCADISEDGTSIIPRADLSQSDFTDIWWVGDKANGGFVAVQLKNALSTGGFSLQTTKNGKGQTSLEITGHVSLKAQKEVPMKFYSIDTEKELVATTVVPEAGNIRLFNTLVSDMQTNVNVGTDSITGTLHFIEGGLADSGPLAGDGHFLALKFTDIDERATSVLVGLEPSLDTGLVELINDPDKNGVFKVTGEIGGVYQKFKVVTTDGTQTVTKEYSLTGLVLEEGV